MSAKLSMAFEVTSSTSFELFGEFRSVNKPLGHRVGDASKGMSEASHYIAARMFKRDESCCHFIFMPPGKWNYEGKLKPGDKHLFRVYFVVDGRIEATHDSNPFQVIPIWKAGHPVDGDKGSDGEEEDIKTSEQEATSSPSFGLPHDRTLSMSPMRPNLLRPSQQYSYSSPTQPLPLLSTKFFAHSNPNMLGAPTFSPIAAPVLSNSFRMRMPAMVPMPMVFSQPQHSTSMAGSSSSMV